ncbi:DUF4279 domain-containing protein [Bergeyella zoohelcum]|uniref:DUF4279 domain-containing protein n=1 Tax=Bergeyella zoohelcum TaxID=1015 RepID=UPI002A91B3C0|nr:DUF4279 domain-containing protein [Bergeyella zoohelcum]MDY6024799.1 DUF4279 domain-containing protein [Bergeyella zoohelcum]
MGKISNDVNLRFCIWDYEDITHEDITNLLGIKPYKIYVKGEKMNPKFNRVSKSNAWILGTPYENKDDFNNQMDKILDVLEPKIFVLKELSERYYCEFSCAIFLNNREESTPWIYLSKRYNDFIRKVNVEFDIDIYYPSLD